MVKSVTALSTVIILLLAIIGPIVVFQFIIPGAGKGITATSACIDPRLAINDKKGYTCYDAGSRELRIQVRRGTVEYELVAIQVLATINGKTEKFEFTENMPNVNEEAVYSIVLNSSIKGEPKFAAIAPVVNRQGLKVVCGMTSRVELSSCS